MQYDLQNLRVMHVDNNVNMHNIVKNILNAMWIKEACYAADPAEAFHMMKVSAPDIIISELVMEPLDGFDFIRLIRKGEDSSNPHVPILVLSGHCDYGSIVRARDAGATEFLAKPVSIKLLHDRIVWMISKPRPFVRTPKYFGPDRRRALRGYPGTERRSGETDFLEPPNMQDLPESQLGES